MSICLNSQSELNRGCLTQSQPHSMHSSTCRSLQRKNWPSKACSPNHLHLHRLLHLHLLHPLLLLPSLMSPSRAPTAQTVSQLPPAHCSLSSVSALVRISAN